MFTHTDIWRAIDRLALTFGYSASGLAKKAGLDPTTFNKSKRFSADGKPRWPSTESIAKILAVTGATMSEFISLTGDKESACASAPSQDSGTIPLLGYAQAGRAGYFDDAGYPAGEGWDHISLPHIGHSNQSENEHEHCYALKVSGESMQPLYRAGDILIVSPAASLRRGDRVIVKTTGGEIMAKELLSDQNEQFVLRSFHPDHDDIALPRTAIAWIARIVWVSQ